MLLEQQRQRAEVVEVTVRQDHAVNVALDLVDLRQRLAAVELRVEAAIDHQPLAAEFGEHAVGADLTAGVQVGKSHQEGSEGGVIAKTGIRVKTRSPDRVVPWKEPSAVVGPPARW